MSLTQQYDDVIALENDAHACRISMVQAQRAFQDAKEVLTKAESEYHTAYDKAYNARKAMREVCLNLDGVK